MSTAKRALDFNAFTLGANPATVAELHQLRAATRRQARKLEIFKKAIAIFHSSWTNESRPLHRR